MSLTIHPTGASIDEVAARRALRPDGFRPARERLGGNLAIESYTLSVLRAWQASCDLHAGRPTEIVFADGRALVGAVLQTVTGRRKPPSSMGGVLRSAPEPGTALLASAVGQLARLRDTMCACIWEDLVDGDSPGAEIRLHRCIDALCLEVVAEVTGQLEQVALVDHLTGLANRLAFERDLPGELEASGRYRRAITLIAVDRARFRQGRPLGGSVTEDLARRQLAACLNEAVRTGDRVYRLDDDDFIVLLRDASQHAADAVAQRAVGRGAPPFDWGAACTLRDGREPAGLLEAASRRLARTRRADGAGST